ncbi:MAG: ATP-dependent helicase [Lachnospiraceae bacterium]|jgi:DNA helicase-2/ATP-dependent DNA helicase PcrA|nr:ATP-dependent helicase [Lachnospiraceae bacterium]
MGKLNEFQERAVRHENGPALVLAGPGSGKTTVVTRRVKQLIEGGVWAGQILVITFTRAAAKEMETRFEGLMDGKKLPVTFGTFHSVYFRVLKHAYHYDAAQIIGDEKRLRLLSEELSEEEPSMSEESLEFLQEVLSEISSVKNDMLDLETYYSKSCPEELFRRLFRAYERRLRKENVIDFDDMLSLCYELFKARRDILEAWQRKYQYILCDEFQDINRLQYEILKLLALPQNNLFVVGDDDQAIYRFRGARPELMLHFEQEYPEAKRYLLTVNYRSQDKIIGAAGNLISHNQVRFGKKISGTDRAGFPVVLGGFSTEAEENRRILSHIQAYHKEGMAYEEMAVLSRTNTGGRGLLSLLMEYNIPFQTKDRIPSLYTHWICGDILAYVRAAMGDESRGTLLRILNKPCRYVSRSVFSVGNASLAQIEAMYEEKPWMAKRIRELSEDLRTISRRPPYQALVHIRKAVGYDDYLRAYAKERNLEEGELFAVAEELLSDAGEYQSFPEWFAHMDRYREEMEKQREGREPAGVVFSTMHGAKGLEYEAVFLPNVNEQVIPHKKAGLPVDVEEERRLFYVAMTRAKEKLHVYWVKERCGMAAAPSRFVRELKAACRTEKEDGSSGAFDRRTL